MKKIFCLMLGLLFALSANAALIIQDEITNIDGDLDGSLDDLLISQISFDVSAGTSILFDALVWEKTGVDLNNDGELTGFNNYMRLFSGTSLLFTHNDEAFGPDLASDGSVDFKDGKFSYNFANAGSYLLTIGHFYYSSAEALLGYDKNKSFTDYMNFTPYQNAIAKDHGDWQLTFNVLSGELSNVNLLNPIQSQAVPEPATALLFLAGLLGLASKCRLRQ